jgi:L-aspartate semialdehyde sulfurtransferase ferredoxin
MSFLPDRSLSPSAPHSSGKARFGTLVAVPIVDVNVSAGPQAVGTPWISTLCRDFNILVRIVKASVDTDFGWFHLQLEGPAEEIQRATAWLMTTGMHIAAEQRSVGVS